METRSRKRAEASSSQPPVATRAAKRRRTTATSSSSAAAAAAASVTVGHRPPMEPSASSGRRRASSRNQTSEADASNKGKESEQPESSSAPDRDENAGGAAAGVFHHHQNLTSASSALQGLLRKLGAGFDELIPTSMSSQQSSELKTILSGLRADVEEGRQVEALTQLCEILSIGTEDSLSSFPVDSFVPILVGLLNHESNPDTMLLAARALTHLCDVLPSSCASVVHYGAIPCFCARLLTIEYMDLAEQSLQALKKISLEHPAACLRAGALMAVLSYLDFFSTGVQRVALSTAENMCKKLPADAADFVMEAVPLLTNLLQYHDSKVLDHASVCLTRIAEAFSSSSEKLDKLCDHGLVAQTVELISINNSGQSSLSTSTYTGLIRLLSTCASGSPLGAKTLLLLGISGIVKDILSGSDIVANISASAALSRPVEQIYEIVNLANELLPPLPEGTISLPICFNTHSKGSDGKQALATSSKQGTDELKNGVSAREKLLQDQPELLQQFAVDLLPVLTQIYGSSVNGPVRYKCLSAIGKLMYFSSATMIQSLISTTNLSSFIAGALACKDPQILIPSLQIAEIMMEKLPQTFSKMFVREGVVHAVDALIQPDSSTPVLSKKSISDKHIGSSDGPSSRSRRYRRRSGGLYVDEPKLSVPNPISTETPNPNSSPRTVVSAHARVFRDKYFPVNPGEMEVGVTDDLLHLKSLCSKLNASVENVRPKTKGKSKVSGICPFDNISTSTEEKLDGVIREMLAELCKGDGVSTFEFIGSGVVSALLNYFSFGTFGKERVSESNLPKLCQLALRRYKSFTRIALPLDANEENASPMIILVRKLQNALSSLEHFPVVLSHSSRSSSGGGNPRISSGLGALMHPCKLRLRRAEGETDLFDYSSNIILISPLASLAAVEEFLWPRVQRTDSGSGTMETPASSRRPSTRSRSAIKGETSVGPSHGSASSSKGKGKAILKPTLGEGSGPQTRNTARRRAASDKDTEMKSAQGDTNSEDEELDLSHIEIDDDLMVEDDDSEDDDELEEMLRDVSLPGSILDKVHDVKLGDPTDDDDRAQPSPNGRGSRVGQDTQPAAANNNNKLIFTAGGKQLSKRLTVYQAIQRQNIPIDDDYDARFNGPDSTTTSDGSRLWSDSFTITYQKADNILVDNSIEERPNSYFSNPTRSSQISLLDSILQGELPCDLEKSNPTYNILALLRVLECLNQLAPQLRAMAISDDFAEGRVSSFDEPYRVGYQISSEEFINGKLTPKLARQIQDALALCSGSLPSWCYQMTIACPFLFPFETRRQYFNSTAFGLSRALHRLQQQNPGSTNERETRISRLQRQKVRVSRNRILDSATKVMEMYAGQKSVLEVEYFGEVGTGLGPTLEFYTLLSHDLQKVGFGLWRSDSPSDKSSLEIAGDDEKDGITDEVSDEKKSGFDLVGGRSDLIRSPLGLFPCPWPPNADTSNGSKFLKVIEHFRLIGRLMAKALQDGRLLDLPLSTAFYKLVLGQELYLYDILSFDGDFGKILQEMQVLVCRTKFLEAVSGNNQKAIADLRFRGALIEDLCLDFTLPGYPNYILKEGGQNISVNINNLEEYISLVVDATVKTGIARQMEAFRAGFNQVFDITSLQIFSPRELDYLICGRRELWALETLADHIKYDHGFTAKSPAILNLLEIMGEFTPDQQHAFCQFVTGAPRLPPGGLAALNPKLTIVRKLSVAAANTTTSNGNGVVADSTADDDLPSVMTCVNYLKLPPYSTKEIMFKKLMYAISEGQGSFDLS